MLKFDVMENIGHGLLEGGSNNFESEYHFSIGKSTSRVDISSFVSVFPFNLYLIIVGGTIHEKKKFIMYAFTNDIINERGGIIILWISIVEVPKFNTHINVSLFLINGN
jgi:hypothetical protein